MVPNTQRAPAMPGLFTLLQENDLEAETEREAVGPRDLIGRDSRRSAKCGCDCSGGVARTELIVDAFLRSLGERIECRTTGTGIRAGALDARRLTPGDDDLVSANLAILVERVQQLRLNEYLHDSEERQVVIQGQVGAGDVLEAELTTIAEIVVHVGWTRGVGRFDRVIEVR